jgi:hypothetical protein
MRQRTTRLSLADKAIFLNNLKSSAYFEMHDHRFKGEDGHFFKLHQITSKISEVAIPAIHLNSCKNLFSFRLS